MTSPPLSNHPDDSKPVDYAYLRLWRLVRDADGEQHRIEANNDLQRWAEAEASAKKLVDEYRLMRGFIRDTGLSDAFETWRKVHLTW